MIYNRSIEGSSSLPQHEAEVTTMLKDMDFGVYGKGVDGYVHYSPSQKGLPHLLAEALFLYSALQRNLGGVTPMEKYQMAFAA